MGFVPINVIYINLIFVHHFTNQNNVFVEFYLTIFCQGLNHGVDLLKGLCKNAFTLAKVNGGIFFKKGCERA